jgi:hypothetical protein
MKGKAMHGLEAIYENLSTWIVLLLTGAIVWMAQQVAPAAWVKATWWQKVMKVSPLILGALLALVPPLNPVPGNLVHSVAVGFILGTMAQSAYGLLRTYGPEKFRALLGARAKRKEEK